MIYAVLFEDEDTRADMRLKHMPEHLAFLERHAREIVAASPLMDATNDTPAAGGRLWIVNASTPRGVRSLIEADPFWPTGLRKSVRILEWTQVFVDGKRRV